MRLAAALVLSLVALSAAAQTQVPSTVAPGRDRPIPEAAPPSTFDFTIEAPRRSPVPRAVEELAFEIKDIRVVGATVYTPIDLRPLVQPLIGTPGHLSDIVGVAEKIEAKYRADGYILSRAFVPPQSVSDGVFQISVVEGYVDAIAIDGGDDDTRDRVRNILAPVTLSRPLQFKVIESALLRANELPGTGVSGLLRPSATQPGASDLAVTISSQPISTLLSYDDRNTKLTDRRTIEADVAVRSPLNDGGQIQLMYSQAPRINERHTVSAKYLRPVGTEGITVSFGWLKSYSEPMFGTATGLQLVTNSLAVGPRATYPLLISRQNRVSLDAGFTWQSADVKSLDQPLTHDSWRVLDVALTYQNVGFLGGVTSVSVDAAHGLNALGAYTGGDGTPLSRTGGRVDFTKLSSILRRNQPIWGQFSASLVGQGQLAMNTLLLGEEVSFGGTSIGRGYDPASLIGDSGIGGAFELRYDEPVAYTYLQNAQLYAFYDVAKVYNHVGGPPNNDTLESVGFGLRLTVNQNLSGGAELAHVMIPLPNNNDGTRNTRILVNAAARF